MHLHAYHGRTIRVTSVYTTRATPYAYSYRVTGTRFPGPNIPCCETAEALLVHGLVLYVSPLALA